VKVAPTRAALICCENAAAARSGRSEVVADAFGLLVELDGDHIKVEVVPDDALLQERVEGKRPLVNDLIFLGFA